jgi:hypothetical protein
VKYTTALGTAFATTTGNGTPTIALTADGWTATLTNLNTTKTCAIYIGTTPITPATREGEPKCQ